MAQQQATQMQQNTVVNVNNGTGNSTEPAANTWNWTLWRGFCNCFCAFCNGTGTLDWCSMMMIMLMLMLSRYCCLRTGWVLFLQRLCSHFCCALVASLLKTTRAAGTFALQPKEMQQDQQLQCQVVIKTNPSQSSKSSWTCAFAFCQSLILQD